MYSFKVPIACIGQFLLGALAIIFCHVFHSYVSAVWNQAIKLVNISCDQLLLFLDVNFSPAAWHITERYTYRNYRRRGTSRRRYSWYQRR